MSIGTASGDRPGSDGTGSDGTGSSGPGPSGPASSAGLLGGQRPRRLGRRGTVRPGSARGGGGPPGSAIRPLTLWDQIYLGCQRADPTRSLDKSTLLYLAGPAPSAEQWRAHLGARLAAWPALRQRLTPLPGAPAEYGWAIPALAGDGAGGEDGRGSRFDLDYHAAFWDAPAGLTGAAAARAAVDALAATRLDLTRAPWRAVLVREREHPARPVRAEGGATPAPAGETGAWIVYRSSHVQQDGIAMHNALWMLFGPDRADSPAGPAGPGGQAGPPPIGRLRPAEQDRLGARGLAAEVARTLRNLGGANRLTAWGGPAVGASRHRWVETELPAVRALARRHGVTVNDVFLAALAGAVREWSLPDWRDSGRRVLHTIVPVSTRPPEAAHVLSNYSGMSRVALPCAEPDPAVRLERIAARTRQIRGGDPGALERAVLRRLKPATIRRIAASSTRVDARGGQFPVVASNPRGMPGPLAVAGVPITRLVHLPARIDGVQPLCVVFSGLDEQVGVGFTVSSSLPGGDRLPGLWLAELRRLHAL